MEWIAKKLTSRSLNHLLGWFIEDINEEKLNDSFKNGELVLTDTAIQRDALSFLDCYYGHTLPIEVVRGRIGKLRIKLPLSQVCNFLSQPLSVEIEDVLLVVGPVKDHEDTKRHVEVERASKRSKLQALFPENTGENQEGYLASLYASFFNNLEVQMSGIHVRYEDTVNVKNAIALGMIIRNISVYSTNSKWKKTTPDASAGINHKVVDLSGFSVYINPKSEPQRLVKPHTLTSAWQEYMRLGLNSYTINSEPFKFVLEPVRCKVKLRQQLHESGKESRVPGLLVDAVVKESATMVVTRDQIQALGELSEAFSTVNRNRFFRTLRPTVPLKRHAAEWWKYAYNCILSAKVKPLQWHAIKKHRTVYKNYIKLYKSKLMERLDENLDEQLGVFEEQLNVLNITLARCQAKIEINREHPHLLVPIQKTDEGWLSAIDWIWKGKSNTAEKDIVASDVNCGVLSCLTDHERELLAQTLHQLEHKTIISSSVDKDVIDQKIYITLQNLCISLRDNRHEVAVTTLSGFSTSFESRHAVNYHKFSVKMDSLMVEGCNLENDLVTVVKLVEETNTRGYGFAFSCDYEINPLATRADYGLSVRLHPLEVTYNQNAFSELIHFFQLPTDQSYYDDLARNKLTRGYSAFKSSVSYILARRKTYHLDIDIKSPYIILPEHGSIQSGGNVLIIDTGGLKILTEIGDIWTGTENATQMELEEKLYDRFSITVGQLQILFSDSGDEWRVNRSRDDSDLHLLHRVKVIVNIANSVCPSYREKPLRKLDFHITPIKINLSENRLTHLFEFSRNFPFPYASSYESKTKYCTDIDDKHFKLDIGMKTLFEIKRNLSVNICSRGNSGRTSKRGAISPLLSKLQENPSVDISQTSLELLEYFPSDGSDDDVDAYLKVMKVAIDGPGFDENISPNNVIKTLIRFSIDEIVISLSRSNDRIDKPYLMLRFTHLVLETALMGFGSAVQITLKSVHLVDKFHPFLSGKYLELISTPQESCFITVMFRKVQSKCPDFATHFHSTEQSLIVNVSSLNLVWHRGSLMSLFNFGDLLATKFKFSIGDFIDYGSKDFWNLNFLKASENSSIPIGATKWSFALHVNNVNMKICDNEFDFVEAKLLGFEFKSLCKANDRRICQVCLSNVIIDDLSEVTLHNRILEVEEDMLFDIKYDELSSCAKDEYAKAHQTNKPDAYFDVRIGKIQIVLLWKFIADLQRFFEPIITKDKALTILNSPKRYANDLIEEKLIDKRVMYHFDIKTPTILVPQKSDSPCLLLLNLGSLKIENMFSNSGIENFLIEFSAFHINRAVLTLGGSLEIQESILEPAKIRCDIKRSKHLQLKDTSEWDVDIQFGTVRFNLGQRDLNTIIVVTTQNYSEAQFPESPDNSRPTSPADCEIPAEEEPKDTTVDKLEAFFKTPEFFKLLTLSITVDQTTITFYKDMDEVLSSPLRDAATALARLDMGELNLNGEVTIAKDLQLRLTIDYCDVFDVRPDSDSVVKKLFGQHNVKETLDFGAIHVSTPHLFCATFKSNQNGDTSIEMCLEKTRLNVSSNFILSLYKYVREAWPTTNEHTNPFHFNFVDEGDSDVFGEHTRRPPSSSDSTSGYLSTETSKSENTKVTTISIQVKSPEIIIFSDCEKYNSQVLVINFDVNFDYSKHPSYVNLKLSLFDISISAAKYTEIQQVPYPVLEKCNFSCSVITNLQESQEYVTIKLNRFSFHFNPVILDIVYQILHEFEELYETPKSIHLYLPSADLEDLWTPKKLSSSQFHFNETSANVKLPNRCQMSQTVQLTVDYIEISIEDHSLDASVPVIQVVSSLNSEIVDWKSSNMSSRFNFNISINHFNDEKLNWEPILEPIREHDNSKRPLEFSIHVYNQPSESIAISKKRQKCSVEKGESSISPFRRSSFAASTSQIYSGSSSDSDQQCDSEMLILKAQKIRGNKPCRGITRKNNLDPTTYLHPPDSDSDAEDSVFGNLSGAFAHLFISDSETEVSANAMRKTGDAEMASSSADEDTDENFITEHEPNSEIVEMRLREMNEHIKESWTRENIVNVVDNCTQKSDEKAVAAVMSTSDAMEFTLSKNMLTKTTDLLTRLWSVTECRNLGPILPPLNADLQHKKIKLFNEIGMDFSVSVLSSGESVSTSLQEEVVKASYGESFSSMPSTPISMGSRDSQDLLEDTGAIIDWDQINLVFAPYDDQQTTQNILKTQNIAQLDEICLDPVKLFKSITSFKIKVTHPCFEPLVVYLGNSSSKRVFQLHSKTESVHRYYVIVNVQFKVSSIEVTVKSPLEITNATSMPLNICFKKTLVEQFSALGGESSTTSTFPLASPCSNPFSNLLHLVTLMPEESYVVPLAVAYNSALHVQPSATEYRISDTGAWWREMRTLTRPVSLTCQKSTVQHITFGVNLEEGSSIDNYQHEEGLLSVVPNYKLSFIAPVTLFNHLPNTLGINESSLTQSTDLDPGSSIQIYHFNSSERLTLCLQLVNYLGSDWQASLDVTLDKADDTRPLTFTSVEYKKKVELAVRTVRSPALVIYVHAPYWLVNKTGSVLSVRGSRCKVRHESNSQEEIIFFRYKRNYPKKMKIRIGDSDYSSSFSVECAGNDGLVVCRDSTRNKRFRISTYTELSNLEACVSVAEGPLVKSSHRLQLSRIVNFSPYFLMRNMTNKPLRFMEENDQMDLWNDLDVGECKPFWPERDDCYMVVKLRDGKVFSQRFHFNSTHSTVLRMEKGRALVVRVFRNSPTNSPMVISFEKYSSGDVPVRVENRCDDVVIKLRQQTSNQVTLIPQHNRLLYTWDEPSLPRVLMWSVYDTKREEYPANVNQDGEGHCLITLHPSGRSLSQSSAQPKKRPSLYRMRRRQRAKTARSSSEEEETSQKTDCSSRGDRITLYWISYKDHRQRVLLFTQSDRVMSLVKAPREKASFQLILSVLRVGVSLVTPSHELCHGTLNPSPSVWELLFNGKWKSLPSLELCAWLEDQYLHNPSGKVNLQGTLQVDFDKMLMYKPMHVKMRRVQQPALFSLYRQSKHYKSLTLDVQNVQVDNQLPDAQYPTVLCCKQGNNSQVPCVSVKLLSSKYPKHVSVIGQEFTLKISEDFICKMESFLSPLVEKKEEPLHHQLKQMLTPITFQCSLTSPPPLDVLNVEKVCIAGFSFNLSYSPSSQSNLSSLGDVIMSIGANVREVSNVKISIGQYEREGTPLETLISDYWNHSRVQLLQQIHVLVLGLDILGNPYHRVKDLTQGVSEPLYDSQLGLLEDPDSFSCTVSSKVRQFLGLVVSGNNALLEEDGNTVTKVARNYNIKRRPKSLSSDSIESHPRFLQVNPSFLTGVMVSLASTTRKPATGFGEPSVEDFFRGIGKGVMCLMGKPALGVMDLTNFAMDALSRATHMGVELDYRCRIPRHVCTLSGVQCYNIHTAQGTALLSTLRGGQYRETEVYYGHAVLKSTENPPIALITKNNIFMVERYGLSNPGEITWRVPLASLSRNPVIDHQKLTLSLRDSDVQLSGGFRSIESEDMEALTYLKRTIETLMTMELMNQHCPDNN